ncbi:MAG: hypothetical protein H7A25_12290 [Leptospiraceae bacterium]|nr:hypothetical protein [Leptospiraceae bacterium]
MLISELLIWPQYGWLDFFYGFLILLCIYAFLRISTLFYEQARRKNQIWNFLHEEAVKRGLTHKEIQILRFFFKNLKKKDKEQLFQEDSRETVKKNLFSLFAGNTEYPVQSLVKIFEKLFSKPNLGLINSLSGLYEGESCGIEISSQHFLGTILKIDKENLTLSTPGIPMSPEWNERKAFIYVYRPNSGSYLLEMKVQATFPGVLKVYQLQNIQMKGDEHLMVEIHSPILLKSWKGEKNSYETGFVFPGNTFKISDRGILFWPQENALDSYLAKNGIWELEMSFGEIDSLHCLGKIQKSERLESVYIFRFINLNEEMRQKLFQEILKHSPIRENLA